MFNKKEDLIVKVAELKGISKTKAKEDVELFLSAMVELIADKEKEGLDIYGLVKFVKTHKEESTARNVVTQETIVVPAHTQIRAKLSKKIKDLVR